MFYMHVMIVETCVAPIQTKNGAGVHVGRSKQNRYYRNLSAMKQVDGHYIIIGKNLTMHAMYALVGIMNETSL